MTVIVMFGVGLFWAGGICCVAKATVQEAKKANGGTAGYFIAMVSFTWGTCLLGYAMAAAGS